MVALTGPMLSRSRAGPLIAKLESSLGVPVVPIKNPRGINDPSLGQFGKLLNEADLVLFLGKRVDFSVNFGNHSTFDASCRFAIVDPDADALRQSLTNLGDRAILSSLADTRLAASKLAETEECKSSADPTWSERVAVAIKMRPTGTATITSGSAITPKFVCDSVARIIEDCAEKTLIVDGGEFG